MRKDGSGGDLSSRILNHCCKFASCKLVLPEHIGWRSEVKQIVDDEGIPEALMARVEIELLIERLVSGEVVHEAVELHLEDEDFLDSQETSYFELAFVEVLHDLRQLVPVRLQ